MPAAACGAINVGDYLRAVDGSDVCGLSRHTHQNTFTHARIVLYPALVIEARLVLTGMPRPLRHALLSMDSNPHRHTKSLQGGNRPGGNETRKASSFVS